MRHLRDSLTTAGLAAVGLVPLLAASPQVASAQVEGREAIGAPVERGVNFQEPVTPVAEMLVSFHNAYLLPIVLGIVVFVLVLMAYILIRFRETANPVPSKTSHNTLLEVVWTVVPVILLMIIVVPSMRLLYFQDTIPEADMTVKATGDTWAWNYSYPDFAENVEEYVSNVLDEETADELGVPYLLASDAPLVVPVDTVVKVLVTSNNNMHSFAMPSFGIKMDAVPGIVNETWFEARREGTFYGQCSEICGIKHAYMPIHIEVVSKPEFAQWIANGGSFIESAVADAIPSANALPSDALPK